MSEHEEIVSTIEENLEKIARKIWAPELSGWRVWIIGRKGSSDIEFSDYLTGGTKPNPANYDKDQWIIEVPVWTDLLDVSNEKLREGEETGDIYDWIWRELDPEDLARAAFFPTT